jgi:hypothetical protein
VFGRTIDEALKRAAPERARGITHSFDMLGEAAMTFADAEKYRLAYEAALARLAREAGAGVAGSPGISVKLSALHPNYNFFHADEARAAMVPLVRDLAIKARDADIHFTIDAEEAERLELSLDIIEELVGEWSEELFCFVGGGGDDEVHTDCGAGETAHDACCSVEDPRTFVGERVDDDQTTAVQIRANQEVTREGDAFDIETRRTSQFGEQHRQRDRNAAAGLEHPMQVTVVGFVVILRIAGEAQRVVACEHVDAFDM